MREILPINLFIFKQLRKELNLSILDVASKINKKPEIIERWESGEDSPTYIQLEFLAQKVFKKPIVVFFMPRLPYNIEPNADFRAMPMELNKSLPSGMIHIYEKAKAMQYNLMELYSSSNSARSFFDYIGDTGNMGIVELSEILRSYLDISLEEQTQWGNCDKALQKWRNVFEKIGITVFKDAFRNFDYSGFCLFDEMYPLIYLNNSMPKSRQIFTLFHEMGHIIFKNGGIDINNKVIFNRYHSSYNEIEIKCNKLAGEFLFPISVFRSEALPFSENNVEILAAKYSVSRELVMRKYLDIGQIDEKTYDIYRNKWIEQLTRADKKKSGGNYYKTQKAYLSERYLGAVFQNYYKGSITELEVADYLNIKVDKVGKFEMTFLQGVSS